MTKNNQSIYLLLLIWGLLSGCSEVKPPQCPEELRSTHEHPPPSAGCFAVLNRRLLVVQEWNGKVSIPGGGRDQGESGRCAAFRETWEETGLHLIPQQRIRVFSNGFHLYECAHHGHSGAVDPPHENEIKNAFYLSAQEFDAFEWRFPEQKKLFREMLLDDEK